MVKLSKQSGSTKINFPVGIAQVNKAIILRVYTFKFKQRQACSAHAVRYLELLTLVIYHQVLIHKSF